MLEVSILESSLIKITDKYLLINYYFYSVPTEFCIVNIRNRNLRNLNFKTFTNFSKAKK